MRIITSIDVALAAVMTLRRARRTNLPTSRARGRSRWKPVAAPHADLTLTQSGETLTGTYSSQVFGEQKITGTIKGNGITFEFTATIEGNAVKVTYTGTVETATMKGKVTIGDLGEGTLTAKKQ